MGLPRIGFAKHILVLYSIIFVLVLLVTDWTLSHFLQERDLLQLQSSLMRQSVLVRDVAIPLLNDSKRLQGQIKKTALEIDVRITVIDPHGVVLADSSESLEKLSQMDNHGNRPEVAAALRQETGVSIRYSMTLKTRMLYVAIPVLAHEKILGVVRTAMPITHVDEILASIRRPVMHTAILGILIVLIAGMFFSHHLARRIRSITSVAERYAQGDFFEKILIDGHDELKMLANTMNQMAVSLRSRIEDLESEKDKLSVILLNMSEGVIAISKRKECVMANPAAEKIFELASAGNRGKSLIEMTRHPQIERIVDRAFQEGKNISDEIQISGKIKKILRMGVIALGTHTRDIGGILVFHDMTELRRLENVRKEFVANVSHELRTPLTSIKGFIETLLGGNLKDPAITEKFLKIVSEEADRLGRLVEEILTLGEIEQGAAPFKKEKIDLSSALPTILERFRTQIQEKKIEVENCISGKHLQLSGDKDKIHQVFVNLIDNAIKFNKLEGKIVLSADQKPEGITITIDDTGIGIPEEDQYRIFERFFRVDKARSKEMGGTGLGLAIVKHIMEAHGGRATCQSTSDQGSRFSVFFPA